MGEGFDVTRSQRGGGGDLRFSRRLRVDYLWGSGEPDHAISRWGGCYYVDCDGLFAIFSIERRGTKSAESCRTTAGGTTADASVATTTRAIWMGNQQAPPQQPEGGRSAIPSFLRKRM